MAESILPKSDKPTMGATLGKLQRWMPHPLLAFRIDDDSMADTSGTVPPGPGNYPAGYCTIVIDPTLNAMPGDSVVVEEEGTGGATFRHLESDGGQFVLKPINPAFATIPLMGTAKIRGVLVGVHILTEAGKRQQAKHKEALTAA